MVSSKLRIKYGEHEFEARGASDVVQEQLKVFLRLIAPQHADLAAATHTSAKPVPLEKLFRIRGRIMSLTVPAHSDDAVLLLLFAQKQYRKNDKVTGGQIMSGLRISGVRLPRVDHILKKHGANGNVTISGSGRSCTYRLTDAGLGRAQGLAQNLVRLVQ